MPYSQIATKPQRVPQRGGSRRPPPFVEAAGRHLLWWLCSYAACGYVALWLCSYVAMWLYGNAALWLCGYVSLKNSKFLFSKNQKLGSSTPENLKFQKSSVHAFLHFPRFPNSQKSYFPNCFHNLGACVENRHCQSRVGDIKQSMAPQLFNF